MGSNSRRNSNRKRRVWRAWAGIGLLASGILVSEGCRRPPRGPAAEAPSAAKQLYRCPMHPEVVREHPDDCPICGMRLVPFTPEPAPPSREAGRAGPPDSTQTASAASHASTSSPPPVMALGEERARLAGIRTVVAAAGHVGHSVRAVGTVVVDETRVRQVTTKVAGFVERLYVSVTGQMVAAGDPLFDLYSPELLASQEEYLRATRSAREFEKSGLPEVRQGGRELVEAARRRLELFDVPPEVIERLAQTGQAQRTVGFRAPFGGFVTGKSIVAGQRIEPGMDLLTVSDLSRVWVMAQVYEAESAFAQAGRRATVTLPYGPGETRTGRVAFVSPTLDVESRTLTVRLEFDNPRGGLKPGMFVDVELAAAPDTGVVVPDGAVLDTGTRQLVFVESRPGEFLAREVTVGVRAGGQAVVHRGLTPGERVAVSANFLLDSESRLRAAAGVRR